jgi:hypothetical protein
VTAFNEQFQGNTNYFCPAFSTVPIGTNEPCDGNYNGGGDDQHYGTIDAVQSGYNNGGYGNYAPETPALYKTWMAVISGDADQNQGVGCPAADMVIAEYCTGPYALFGGGLDNVFPSGGFTITDDLYLSPTTVSVAGTQVDNDVALNASNGGFGSDNTITACFEAGGFGFTYSEGSPGPCSPSVSPVVTTDGWYRFVWVFNDHSGKAYVTESVYSEPATSSSTPIATSGNNPIATGTAISNWGGPLYLWFPTEDISGLPLANFALQLGKYPTGHAS